LADVARRPRFYYGYVIAALAFLIQVVFWGTYRSFGLFFNPLGDEFGWSREQVAGAASMGWLIVGLMNLPAGAMVDRFGPRRTLAIGGVLFGAGYILMSVVSGLWQVYLFYVVLAVGMSAADVVPLSTVARWFIKARGTITGLSKIGAGVGMMATPLVAGYFIETHGWRTAYLALGATALVVLLIIARFIRRDPSTMGLTAYGAGAQPATALRKEEGTPLREALRMRQFWTVCVAYFLLIACSETVMVHTVPHAEDLGISSAGAAGILSFLGGASIGARVVVGVTLDRFGSRRALLLCFVPSISALIWLQFADSVWMLYVFAVLYGLSHGGFFTLLAPVVAQLFGTVAHGAIFGIIMAGGGVSGALAPLLAGRAFDILGSYRLPFLIVVGMAVVALALISSLGRTPYQIGNEQRARSGSV